MSFSFFLKQLNYFRALKDKINITLLQKLLFYPITLILLLILKLFKGIIVIYMY